MRRLCLGLAAVLCLSAACDKKPAAESPAPKSPPAASQESPPTPSASVAAAPSAAPAAPPGPSSGTIEQRKSAVLSLISGDVSADQLPVVATEPGEKLDPSLRSTLAPVSRAKIRFGKINVVGDQMPEVVRRIVRRYYPRFKACYARGLQINPNLEGRIGIRLVIHQSGRTMSANNGGSDLPDGNVVTCVLRASQNLRFPESDTCQVSTVTIPLLFKPE